MTAQPPRPPPHWSWRVAILAVLGSGAVGLATEVYGDRLDAPGLWGWALLAAAVLGALVLAVLEWRARRALIDIPPAPVPAAAREPADPRTTLPYRSGFIGRDADVAWIARRLTESPPAPAAPTRAVAVVGRRGIGTSACAVAAANRVRDEFAHVEYLDLRAADRPLRAAAVVTELAHRLGVAPPASDRPADVTEAVQELGRHLDQRRTLLVLDNVDGPAQVAPLLPPTAETSRLLLAGSLRLTAVDGLTTRELRPLREREAVRLFLAADGRAGPDDPLDLRVADPTGVLREIVSLCGRLPRAVRALGYRAARHRWRRGELRDNLRRAATAPVYRPLRYEPALALVTAVDAGYRELPRAARRLYRLLSLAPGPVDVAAIAALTGYRPRRVRHIVEDLADRGLIQAAPGDRHRVLRPPLGGYARLHLRYAEPPRRAVAAYVRLLRDLARRAERHVATLTGPRPPADEPDAPGAADADGWRRPPGDGPVLAFDDDPGEWLQRHQLVLHRLVLEVTATRARVPRRVRRWWFRLTVALCGWYAYAGRMDDWAAVCEAVRALPAAGRPDIAGWLHNEFGVLLRRRGDAASAEEHLQEAVRTRHRHGAAQPRTNLGLALLDQGRVAEAIDELVPARRHRAHSDRAGEALTDLALGAAHLARDGGAGPARHHLAQAGNAFREVGEQRGYAAAMSNLALAHLRLGENLDAAQAWQAALREYASLSDPDGHAAALLNAGVVLLASVPGGAAKAYELLTESLERRGSRPPTAGLGRTVLHLGIAAHRLGRPDEAATLWTRARLIGAAVRDGAGEKAAADLLAAPHRADYAS